MFFSSKDLLQVFVLEVLHSVPAVVLLVLPDPFLKTGSFSNFF